MIPQINQIILGMFLTYSNELYYIIDKIEQEDEESLLYITTVQSKAVSPEDGVYIPNVYKWGYMEELIDNYATLFERVKNGCHTLSKRIYSDKHICLKGNKSTYNWMLQQGRNLSPDTQVRFILNN